MKIPKEFNGWMHQFEIDYLKDNQELIQDAMDHLSFLPDDCHMSLGGIMHSLSLDDEQRIKMANLWGKTFIEGAKNRLPHLKYLKEDFYARKSLEIKDRNLDVAIQMSENIADQEIQKYINENTYVDMKIKEFIDIAISLNVKNNARHIDVIQYLFNKFEYENRYGKEDDVDNLDIQRDTIEKRYYRIIDKDYFPTIFNITIPPKVL